MKKRTIILLILFAILFLLLIHQSFVKYVYVSPNTNVKVLPYITKIVKPIERDLAQVMNLCKSEYKDMKYMYRNYYGSGFLRYNSLPNDLDISVGVDLGTYEYDGKNTLEIAKSIEDKISSFHLYNYSVFSEDTKTKFVLDQPVMKKAVEAYNKQHETWSNIENGLKNVLSGNLQVVHFNKKFQDNDVEYTFILNQNEVLVNEIQPMFSFTKNVIYNKTSMNYPREVSILPDFYVTVKNKETNEVKHIVLVEESFLGERFQISRRFFVPLVFTGNDSLKYIKNLDYLKDDDKYIEMRLFNYFRYINEVALYFEYMVDPVKLLKRMHQCTDLIEPALSDEEKNKIYSDISNVFENKDVKLVNDYVNIIKNLNVATSNAYIFQNSNSYGYISEMLKAANYTLEELAKNKNYESEIKDIKKFHNELLIQINSLNGEEKLAEVHSLVDDNFVDVSVALTKIINKNIENTKEFVKDFEILENVYKKAGFHQIDIYQKDLNTVFVLKNDFTKNFTKDDFKALAKENNMPENVEYKLIDESSLQKGTRSEFRYVRYKSTDEENKYYQELCQKLLKDKKRFNIKRKYIF